MNLKGVVSHGKGPRRPRDGADEKMGYHVPNYVVVTSIEELTKLGQANEWLKRSKLVVKAHEALGSRFKLGFVKVDLDLKGAEAATGDDRSPCRQHYRLASHRV